MEKKQLLWCIEMAEHYMVEKETKNQQWWQLQLVANENLKENQMSGTSYEKSTHLYMTLAELNGARYPDVDLSAFSDYERMARLSEWLDARMEEAVVNNDYDPYEQLRLAASDIRPGEG